MSSSFNQKIPAHIIEEVKTLLEIVEVVEDYVPLVKRGKDYVGLCPFHEEKTPSFTVSPTKQMYYCFGCQSGGNAIKFLMEIGQRSFTEVVLDLAARYNIDEGWGRREAGREAKKQKPQSLQNSTSPALLKDVPALPPENCPLQIVKLDGIATAPESRVYMEGEKEITEICYPYQVNEKGENTLFVKRKQWVDSQHPKGRNKTTLPYHVDAEGKTACGKGDATWPVYRIAEAIAAIEKVKATEAKALLIVVEGENKVECWREMGFAASTLQGGSWTETALRLLAELSVEYDFGIVYLPDHDQTGYKKASRLASICDRMGAVFLQLNPLDLWSSLPVSGDICDIVAAGISAELIEERLLEVALPFALAQRKNEAANITLLHQSMLNTSSPSVTGDTQVRGDRAKINQIDIPATVTAVTEILQLGLKQWEEQAELDAILSRSVMSKQSFNSLVAAVRSNFDEVLAEDEARVNQLLDWSNTRLDYQKVFPHLASDLLHDAKILNIDPIMLVQYLLPAILSLYGKRGNLFVGSHKIPAIVWTCIVAESGTGKTRAENLILHWIKNKQEAEYRRFDQEWEEYQKQCSAKKNNEQGEKVEPPPAQRKYLFQISTIQSMMQRLSEQKTNGTMWVRDELGGLFKSLNQFTPKGEGEALECLLEQWEGLMSIVDRMKKEDSYITPESRLSIAGGIQPGAYRKIFQDPDDVQGLQARMLYAVAKVQPAKRVKGYCHLAEKLPQLYSFVDNFASGDIYLSTAADARYDAVYEQIGNLAEKGETPAIRFWMRKLPAQMLRVAFALHIQECFFEPARPKHELQLDTLNRAIELCRLYRCSFELVQESVSDGDSPSSMMTKLYDLALKSPTGLLVRDAYRSVKALQRRAKELTRDVAAYTLEMFYKLQEMGKCVVQQNGRSFRLVIRSSPPPEPRPKGDKPGNNPPWVTEVTSPEPPASTETGVSLTQELSPVTSEKVLQVNATVTGDSPVAISPGLQAQDVEKTTVSASRLTQLNWVVKTLQVNLVVNFIQSLLAQGIKSLPHWDRKDILDLFNEATRNNFISAIAPKATVRPTQVTADIFVEALDGFYGYVVEAASTVGQWVVEGMSHQMIAVETRIYRTEDLVPKSYAVRRT